MFFLIFLKKVLTKLFVINIMLITRRRNLFFLVLDINNLLIRGGIR